ncbi:hypothetical protein [Agrobacterium arsenijevicii]|uniref:Uncharacterized protein n=1 Tax=Agrobacterium arsenijevicii TaxID=1585697 RepID=A0ABR5DCR7_9HYPH|nr:hypothetical protein RP75_06050 [Agrobacterium arsenijevicii]
MYSSRYLLSFFKLVLISGFLNSCTAAGYQEFQQYSKAYDAQYVQGDTVLQEVGAAERHIWSKTAPLLNENGTFKPDEAAYYLDNVEPPYTAAVRASLKVIKGYNDAIVALASGENAKALSNRVSTLTVNVAAAVGATRAMGSSTITPAALAKTGAGDVARKLTDQLVLLPVVNEVASIASREAFRTQLINSHSRIHIMLMELRNNGTPVMYEMLREKSGKVGNSRRPLPDPDAQAMLAGWVLLLDKTDIALMAAVAAAKTGSQFNLDTLSQASVELTLLAEQVRTAKQSKK